MELLPDCFDWFFVHPWLILLSFSFLSGILRRLIRSHKSIKSWRQTWIISSWKSLLLLLGQWLEVIVLLIGKRHKLFLLWWTIYRTEYFHEVFVGRSDWNLRVVLSCEDDLQRTFFVWLPLLLSCFDLSLAHFHIGFLVSESFDHRFEVILLWQDLVDIVVTIEYLLFDQWVRFLLRKCFVFPELAQALLLKVIVSVGRNWFCLRKNLVSRWNVVFDRAYQDVDDISESVFSLIQRHIVVLLI